MISNFKCKKCGAVFRADDSEFVSCPRCSSDNVTPIRRGGGGKNYLLIALGVLVAVVVCVIIYLWPDKPVIPVDTPESDPTTIDTTGLSPSLLPLSLEITDQPKANSSNSTYSLTVGCKNLEKDQKITYGIYRMDGRTLVAESTDGNFTNIPASEDNGIYLIKAHVEGVNDASQPGAFEQAGFDKIEKVTDKMTVTQIQKIIDKRDISAVYKSPIIKTCKIIYRGISADEYKPKDLGELFSHLNMSDWRGVKVESVTYNSDNYVNSITVTVEKEDW